MIILPLLAVSAAVPASMTPIDPPAFVMTIDETGRAVCSGPTESQRIMILDHMRHHRGKIEIDGELDYLVDSSEVVTLKFSGVPRDVREAIWHSMDLWYEKLEINVPFTLKFYWEEMEEDDAPLAFARSYWDEDESEGSWGCFDLKQIEFGCITKPLANQKIGYRINGMSDPDPEFEIHLNKNHNWYRGIDGAPGRYQYDLVSVILHELGHAFGFTVAFRLDHDEEVGEDIWGEHPIYYEYYSSFVWSRGEGDLLDLPSPSTDLYDALTSNSLFWGRNGIENWHGESLLSVERNNGPVMLWAPASTTTAPGSIVGHLDLYAFPNNHPDGLMNPVGYPGSSIHRIGPVTLGMLYDLGWDLKGFDRNTTPTPPPPPPDFNPEASESWILSRLIGSEEGSRGTPHLGVLTFSSSIWLGLFGVQSEEPEFDRGFGLYLADRLNDRTADVHMKTDTRWIPYLKLELKNQPAPEYFQGDPGLHYFNRVEFTDAALEAFLENRKSIELHVHFEGDSRRTVLTFPLRVPIN